MRHMEVGCDTISGGYTLRRSQPFQESIRLGQLWKQFLLRVELGRVNAAPAASQLDRMLKVQHFVIDDVFHGTTRDGKVVKDATDDDGIVRGIVMSEDAASPGLAPAHAWPGHQPM